MGVMGWRDLLEPDDAKVTLPWFGGKSLHSASRKWTIEGTLPREFGWIAWKTKGRKAIMENAADPCLAVLNWGVVGYLVGDRMLPDSVRVDPDPVRIVSLSEKVHLLDPGLDRFVRVVAGRVYEEGPLVYAEQGFPLGPEDAVMEAFLNRIPSVADIAEVSPALDASFRMEVYQREQAELRRQELAKLRREEEARRAREERRKQLVERLGDGAIRRELAQEDFAEAARAALAVGGAELLDHRAHHTRGEWVVRYRLDRQRFECVCDTTLRIVDSGICLVNHRTDEKGDTYFTLESLPAVVRQASREGKLVVYRHV